MNTGNNTKTKDEVWEVIESINRAWQNDNPKKELGKYFHKDMVIVAEGYREMGKGKDVCIQSYVDFITKASVKTFEIKEPIINVFGNTAIAAYRYDTSWEMDGNTYSETGHDVFLLIRDEGKWLAVWRTLLPLKEKS